MIADLEVHTHTRHPIAPQIQAALPTVETQPISTLKCTNLTSTQVHEDYYARTGDIFMRVRAWVKELTYLVQSNLWIEEGQPIPD